MSAEDALWNVRALHMRRPFDVIGDGMTLGQTEFPDQCAHCRRAWPCETIATIDRFA